MLIVFVKEESIFFHLGSRVEPRFRRLGRGRLVDQAEELRVVLRPAGAQLAVSSRALRGARYVILNQMIKCFCVSRKIRIFRERSPRHPQGLREPWGDHERVQQDQTKTCNHKCHVTKRSIY